MDTSLVTQILREGIWVAIKLGGPMLVLSMVVGVLIAIFQAVTQIHEHRPRPACCPGKTLPPPMPSHASPSTPKSSSSPYLRQSIFLFTEISLPSPAPPQHLKAASQAPHNRNTSKPLPRFHIAAVPRSLPLLRRFNLQ